MILNKKNRVCKLIVLSAPSGTGKSTIAKRLIEAHVNLKPSISYTTRSCRSGETPGVHYYFIEEAQFQRMVQDGEFLEYAHVFGKSWYGTARKTVEEHLNQGCSVVFDIDVQGAEALKKTFKEECITIFLLPPDFKELEKRLRGRKTETEDAILVRLETAKKELAQAHKFDHQIVNSSLEDTIRNIEEILKKERIL